MLPTTSFPVFLQFFTIRSASDEFLGPIECVIRLTAQNHRGHPQCVFRTRDPTVEAEGWRKASSDVLSGKASSLTATYGVNLFPKVFCFL